MIRRILDTVARRATICVDRAARPVKTSEVMEMSIKDPIAYMKPKRVKGRREVRSRRPSFMTAKRQRMDKYVVPFIMDAITEGIMIEGKDGTITRMVMSNPSSDELCYMLDSGMIGQHEDLKRRITKSKGEEVFGRGFSNKKIDLAKVAEENRKVSEKGQDMSNSSWWKQADIFKPGWQEKQMLARIEERRKKREEKAKKISKRDEKRLRDLAVSQLLEEGSGISVELIKSRMEVINGQEKAEE